MQEKMDPCRRELFKVTYGRGVSFPQNGPGIFARGPVKATMNIV
jgi:hypothetical protein